MQQVVLEPMRVYLERQLRCIVPRSPMLLKLAEVVDASHAFEPGLRVQQRIDLGDGHPGLVVQERVQSWINVAGSGAHHQALKRRQLHRGLDGHTAAYS